MKYMLLIHVDEAAMENAPKEATARTMAAYQAYTEAMKKAGAYVYGDRLATAGSAALVRLRDGKPKVLNGPYAEAREQLGGYYVVEAPDLDAAIAWAARCPGAAFGTVEVRPLFVGEH